MRQSSIDATLDRGLLDRKKYGRYGKGGVSGKIDSRKRLLELEKGCYLKKWTGRLPVALLYPNTYQVGMSSLGFQIVYNLLNQDDRVVCERVFLPDKKGGQLVSVESGRPLDNFPILFWSVSFEHDYVNLATLLLAAGIEPYAEQRPDIVSKENPLVICGGVATFMNPEPLAPFVDLFVVGEVEPLGPFLLDRLCIEKNLRSRRSLLLKLNQNNQGFYAPRFYTPLYDHESIFTGFAVQQNVPARIRKVILERSKVASHSELLTPETEFADLYLTELGRGCSRGCRFCTAGFIYRPPRLWDTEAVVKSLEQKPEQIRRVGLLGMEMTAKDGLESIARLITEQGCSLSFSSLRADRISENILELLGRSELKSVAIAPDGASERLRKVINKGLSEEDLLNASERLVEAGIFKLKLYLMIGLPSETDEDLAEFIELILKIRAVINPIGRKKGRLCQLSISVNSFAPKPWTPFQYHPFGVSERLGQFTCVSGKIVVKELKRKINFLKKGLSGVANTRITFDNPDHVLFQAVLARGDRRIAAVLLDMAALGISWKLAMKKHGLSEELYATRQYSDTSALPWQVIDHSINDSFLWEEYCKAFDHKITVPCDTSLCRRCGVCNG